MRLSLRISFFVFHPDDLRPCYQDLGLLCSFIFRNLYFVVVFYGLLLISLLSFFFSFFLFFFPRIAMAFMVWMRCYQTKALDKCLGGKRAKWGCSGLGPREQFRRFSITTRTNSIQTSYYQQQDQSHRAHNSSPPSQSSLSNHSPHASHTPLKPSLLSTILSNKSCPTRLNPSRTATITKSA